MNISHTNYSIAVDRQSFLEYTPFDSELGGIYGFPHKIKGVGTVKFTTQKPSGKDGRKIESLVEVTGVLHIPGLPCNVLGRPFFERREYRLESIHHVQTKTLLDKWLTTKPALYYYRVVFNSNVEILLASLSEPPVHRGAPAFQSTHVQYIEALERLQVSERQRMDDLLMGKHWDNMMHSSEFSTFIVPPFSDNENAWIQARYGDEHNFLQAHGLKMSHRFEARTLARAMMAYQKGLEDGEKKARAMPAQGNGAPYQVANAQRWANNNSGMAMAARPGPGPRVMRSHQHEKIRQQRKQEMLARERDIQKRLQEMARQRFQDMMEKQRLQEMKERQRVQEMKERQRVQEIMERQSRQEMKAVVVKQEPVSEVRFGGGSYPKWAVGGGLW